MKLLNKKGFILVETLIVALFVVTLFILVYQNLVPAIGEYEAMNNYDDVDSVYAINLFKENLLHYGDMDAIDSYLTSHSYLDITNCDGTIAGTTIYKNSEYCTKIKKSLNILGDDHIFITKYDISDFRNTVKSDEKFDSGKLSSFRNYLATVSNTDSFYDASDESNVLAGKYRLFMTRTITNIDQSTTLKYANLGIYDGKYKRYNMGEKLSFKPGTTTGFMNFYVLKNSTSLEETVTLILADNIASSNTNYNSADAIQVPSPVLNILKNNTNSWNNVITLNNTNTYTDSHGYTINYNGYHARLLEPNDIYEIFGSKIENNHFNNNNELFTINFNDDSSLSFLSNGLTDTSGYWMANMVNGNDEMAWSVQDKKIIPNLIKVDNSTIGVRPVIIVSKTKLESNIQR